MNSSSRTPANIPPSTPAVPLATVPPVVGRLAPSPTGAQHVGNARTFLLAWLSIRARGGRLILRLEDIDSPRVKPGAAQQALADLRWLGLNWDEGPDLGGPHRPYVQTERLELYLAALQSLQAAELVYPCTCTRSDVLAAASAPHVGQEGARYPGTCAGRSAADAVGIALQGVAFSWRFRLGGACKQFVDQFAGLQSCNVAEELGDYVIAKSDGAPAYQLAVVVDDHAMGVTEVLRGDDLLPSTFRQLAIYEHFGWAAPQFGHVPLVVGPDGRRLAKRHGDTRLATLRAAGVPVERLLGLLAHSCGWLPKLEAISLAELLPLYNLKTIPRQPWVFGEAQLKWLLSP